MKRSLHTSRAASRKGAVARARMLAARSAAELHPPTEEEPVARGKKSDKARPAAIETKQTPGNVTDETIEEFARKAVAAYRELEKRQAEAKSANGTYRSILKDAKNNGVDQDSIAWYIRQLKREPDDIDRETRNRNRIARVMGLPIGTQLGLFGDGTTVATVVDETKIADQQPAGESAAERALSIAKDLGPHAAGYLAGKNGAPWDTCPFAGATAERDTWVKGWEDGQFNRTSTDPDPATAES